MSRDERCCMQAAAAGGGDFGGGMYAMPDRDAEQGTAARPGQATKLLSAKESERALQDVMDTVPTDIKVTAFPAAMVSLQAKWLLA